MGNGPGKKDLRPPRHSLGVRTKKLTGAFSGLHNWAQVSCVIPTLVPKSPLLATGYTILPPRGSSSAIMSVGTYSLSGSFTYPTSTLFKASEDIPVTNEGPTMTFVSSDLSPIWSGSTVFSSGYMWSSFSFHQPSSTNYAGQPTSLPASVSCTPGTTVFNTNNNNTYAALCFAQGDPEYGPMGVGNISASQWAAMSFDEVLQTYVDVLTPKVGGPLTSGLWRFHP